MLVRRDERVPLARLLTFLEHGECLAHECARAQAALTRDEPMRRFLLGQARQEAFHAGVFQGVVAWLVPRRLGDCPPLVPLGRYRALIEEAIRARNFPETLLAEQIILEGLGEAILRRIEAGLVKRKAGFGCLRRLLLHQEEAHHDFGRRALDRAFAAGETSPDALRSRGQEYLALTEAMIVTLSELFDSLDEAPSAYVADTKRHLPAWLLP